MITTPIFTPGADHGTRLRVAPIAAWKQQRPELGGFNMINNNTGVSARKRRLR